jgi:hypothetical protein
VTSARLVVVALGCLVAVPALAQVPATPPPALSRPTDAAQKARYQLRVMEGVLENAVQHGIRTVGQQMRVVTPDLIFIGAPSRARGFRLDGFGVFFDVEVPTLRPSMVWTMRTLTQSAPEMAKAAPMLRKFAQEQNDQSTRRALEQVVRMVEAQASPLGGSGQVQATVVAGDPSDPPVAGQAPATPPLNPYVDLPDPAVAYETEVKRAIADAMLDYGTTLNITDEDVLAIAARSNEDVLGGNSYEVVTVMMVISGADLNALRTGTATRDDVRRRIRVQEY